MTEGSGATFDKPQQRPYQEKPLTQEGSERVKNELSGYRGADIRRVVAQLRDPRNTLGQRFVVLLGMYGRPTTSEDALIQAGQVVGSALEERTFVNARKPEDLGPSHYAPVEDFGPEEIGRVRISEEAKGIEMGSTDKRFIGFIDASGEGGWKLGVVDTQEHTVTTLPRGENIN